jgi:hypothetical protein
MRLGSVLKLALEATSMIRRSGLNQAVFRLNYELLKDAGKEPVWQSYDHDEHGFIFVRRNSQGAYAPDAIQLQVVKDSIAYLDGYLKKV